MWQCHQVQVVSVYCNSADVFVIWAKMGVLDAEEVKGRKVALKPLLTPLETGSPVSQADLKLIAYNLELVVLLPQLGVLGGAPRRVLGLTQDSMPAKQARYLLSHIPSQRTFSYHCNHLYRCSSRPGDMNKFYHFFLLCKQYSAILSIFTVYPKFKEMTKFWPSTPFKSTSHHPHFNCMPFPLTKTSRWQSSLLPKFKFKGTRHKYSTVTIKMLDAG